MQSPAMLVDSEPVHAQRMRALHAANQVRTFRAKLKKKITDGKIDCWFVVVRPPAKAKGMQILELLQAQPGVGLVKARKILRRQNISPARHLGELTPRERRALGDALRAEQQIRDRRRAA